MEDVLGPDRSEVCRMQGRNRDGGPLVRHELNFESIRGVAVYDSTDIAGLQAKLRHVPREDDRIELLH